MNAVANLPAGLAYIPFLDPLPGVTHFWLALLVPLAFAVSMSWKAVRGSSLSKGLSAYWKSVFIMTVQILLAVAGIAVGLFILVQLLLPRLPAE